MDMCQHFVHASHACRSALTVFQTSPHGQRFPRQRRDRKMNETSIECVVLRTYYSVLQRVFLNASLRATKYYYSLEQITTNYCSSTTLYYKVLLRTTKCYKVLLRTNPYYKVRLHTTQYYKYIRCYGVLQTKYCDRPQRSTPHMQCPAQCAEQPLNGKTQCNYDFHVSSSSHMKST